MPKNGSACSKCKFLQKRSEGETVDHCTSDYFKNWRKSLGKTDPTLIPAPADQYCCDVFAQTSG